MNKIRQRFLTIVVLAGVILTVPGCITEESGGLPGPAPDEDRVSAQLDLARGYLEQRDWNRAKAPLERALTIDPRNVQAHVLSAVLYSAENETEIAEGHYRTALRLEPENSQALNNYASFLYAQERYEEAASTLEKLVADTAYRARSQAFESLGLAYLKLDRKADARDAFTRALQLNMRLPQSNLRLSELYLQDGELERAQTFFDFHNRLARPSADSLCIGLKLAKAAGNADQEARYQLSLNNMFPEQVEQCLP